MTSPARAPSEKSGFPAARRTPCASNSARDATGAPGSYPITTRVVQGAVVGSGSFNVEEGNSLYLPGSLCEHLTSFGGVYYDSYRGDGQTNIAEWQMAGVAGSSGTGTEPYATSLKFPRARMHTHYFNGATLAEAFAESIQLPQQTLVAGDGLCQPYAKIPTVAIASPAGGSVLSGTAAILVSATGATPLEGDMDLAVDGRVIRIGDGTEPDAVTRTPQGFQVDTATLTNGRHELRVVA